MIKRSESKVQSKSKRRRSERSKQNRRRLMLEGLESRQLLAAGIGTLPPVPEEIPVFAGPRNLGTVQSLSVVENETSIQIGVNDLISTAQVVPLGTGPGQSDTIDLTGSLPVIQSGTQFGSDLDTFAFDLRAGDILDIAGFGAAGTLDLYLPDGSPWLFTNTNQAFAYPSDSPLQTTGNVSISHVVPEDGRYYLTVSALDTTASYQLGLRTYRPIVESLPVGSQQIVFVDFDGAVYPNSVFNSETPSPGITRIPSLRQGLPLLGIEELDDASFNALITSTMAEVEEQFQSLVTNGNNGDFDASGVPGQYGVTVLNSRDHADPGNNPLVTRVIIGGSIADAGIPTIGISSTLDVGNFSMDDIVIGLLDSIEGGVTSVPIANTRSVLDATADFLALLITHEAAHSFGSRHTNNGSATPSITDSGGNFAEAIGAGRDGIYGTIDDEEVEFRSDTFAPEGIFGTNFIPLMLSQTLRTGGQGSGISGVVFNDANRDARRSNEAGVAGVQVFADVNNNGVLDQGESRSTTDANGAFSLVTGGGAVSIVAVTPDNFVATTSAVLSSAGTLEFGIAQVRSDITGTKFADLNGNGVQDSGESGIGGVYIYLDLDGDDRPDLGEPSAQTADDGTYAINFPGPGTYTIREVVPPGFQQTFPATGEHVAVFDGTALTNNFDFGNRPTRDFGDAPAPFNTLGVDGGPSHGILAGLSLGTEIDSEPDGLPSAAANGDDTTGLVDDEDGVLFNQFLGRGDSSNVQVTVTNTTGLPGFLQGWIDFNGNGAFEASESIARDLQLGTGTHTVTVNTPGTALVGETFARFRYSQTAGIGPDGSVDSGEVEDYAVTIANTSGIAQDDEFNVSRNDLSVALDVLGNDLQTSTNALSIQTLDTAGARGVITLSQDRTQVFYTPPNNFIGRDSFEYTVVDQFGNTDTATAVVNVRFQTASPIAIDDAVFVRQNASNRLLNVLDNDLASVNGGLTITSVFNATAGGSVSVVPGGQTVRYSPAPGFTGTEQFGYSVQDAAGQVSQATVTVNLTPASANDDLIEYSFEARELVNRSDITVNDITAGESFELTVFVEDLRNVKTVASAFLDVLYTDELLAVDPDSLVYGELFSADDGGVFQTNDASTPGLLNEFGGTHNQIDNVPVQDGRVKLFSVTVQAISPGFATIQADPADAPTSESIVDGVTAATPSQMRLGNISFRINPAGGQLSAAIDDAFLGQSVSANNAADPSQRNFIPAVDSNRVAIPAAGNQPNILDVLDNDLLGDSGTIIEFGLVTQPGLGTAVIDDAGTPNDLSDDFIAYTANPGAVGADFFEYLIVTGDDVRSVARVDLSVGQSRDYDIALTFEFVDEAGDLLPTDNLGRPIVTAGDVFGVRVDADDIRNQAITEFVFAAYLDLLYDTAAVTPVANTSPDSDNPLDFRAEFGPDIESEAAQGTANRPGILDEFGAPDVVGNSGTASRPDPRNIATAFFTADATGVTDFVGSPADSFPFQDSLIFLEDNPVPVSRISYDRQSISIVGAQGEGPVQNTSLPPDVNTDGFVTPIDALLIVNELARAQSFVSGEAPAQTQLMLDVNGDRVVTPSDILWVINHIARKNESRFASGESVVASALAAPPATSSDSDSVEARSVASTDQVFASTGAGFDAALKTTGDAFAAPVRSSASTTDAVINADSSSDRSEDDLIGLLADDVREVF